MAQQLGPLAALAGDRSVPCSAIIRKASFLQQMRTNTEINSQSVCIKRETLEHSALKGISSSNSSPWGSRNSFVKEAERVNESERMEDRKKQGFLNTAGLMFIRTHRDLGSRHGGCPDRSRCRTVRYLFSTMSAFILTWFLL